MSESTNIPEMRDTIERLSKEKAALSNENADLKAAVRVRDARDMFRREGFSPEHGDLFAAANPDAEITPEAVVSFADQYNLKTASTAAPSEGDPTPKPEADDSDLSQLSGSGSRGGDGGAGGAQSTTLTRQQWKDLYVSDPAQAKAAIASGRVEVSRDNPFVKGVGLPKGTNPYASAADTT